MEEWAGVLARAFRDYGIERTESDCVSLIQEEVAAAIRLYIRNTVYEALKAMEGM